MKPHRAKAFVDAAPIGGPGPLEPRPWRHLLIRDDPTGAFGPGNAAALDAVTRGAPASENLIGCQRGAAPKGTTASEALPQPP